MIVAVAQPITEVGGSEPTQVREEAAHRLVAEHNRPFDEARAKARAEDDRRLAQRPSIYTTHNGDRYEFFKTDPPPKPMPPPWPGY